MHDADLDPTPRLTSQQVADALGITRGRVNQLRHTIGVGTRFGRDVLYSDADVARLRQRQTTPGPPPRTTGKRR